MFTELVYLHTLDALITGHKQSFIQHSKKMVVDKSAKDDDGPAPVEVEPARTKSLGLLKNLPRKREAVRQMTPRYAATAGVCMHAFGQQVPVLLLPSGWQCCRVPV